MKIDAVFSGGGVKAFAFIGALKSIEEKGIKIERVAGTSAGAILSSLIAAGYRSDEIEEMLLKLPLKSFLDPPRYTEILPFTKWYNLIFKMGLYKGRKLEEWLKDVLSKKGIYSFADLRDHYLKVIVSDLSLNRLVVLPDDLKDLYGIAKENFSVARAVRISAGYPLFFIPEKIKNKKKNIENLLVDGGLVSNFPLWVFKNNYSKAKRPTLGLNIINKSKAREIKTSFDLLQAIFLTMKQSFDERVIDQSMKDIISLGSNHLESMDLSLTREEKIQMIKSGEKTARQFLQKWPK